MISGGKQRRLPFSVSHYLCPPSVAFTGFLDDVARQGFAAVALTEAALRDIPAPGMRRELAARGLAVSSVNSAGYFLFEGEAARAQARRNRRLLAYTAELGEARLNVIVGGDSAVPLADARKRAVDALAQFSGEAARLGVRLAVEPYAPWRAGTRNCINTISQATAIFAALPGLTMTADLYHLWWDPDLDGLLAGKGAALGLLQICDVALADDAMPRRVPLGEGFLPWRDQIRAARAGFPDAPVELELFADQLPGRDWPQVLSASARALAGFMET